MKMIRAILPVLTLTALFMPSLGQASSHPLFTKPFAELQKTLRPFAAEPAKSGVQYWGGPVLAKVKIQAVLWGNDVDSETQNQIAGFYAAIADSNYLDWLKEYDTNIKSTDGRDGSHQHIERGSLGGVYTIQPINSSTSLNQAAVEKELLDQIDQGKLPVPDADTIYMVHFPSRVRINISWGGSCNTWCADHEALHSSKYGAVAYAMMPECMSGCGGGSSFDAITWAASHELAEAVTDPVCPLANSPSKFPAAWIRSDGQEIGDLCVGDDSTLKTGNHTYAVQSEWDNARGHCYSGPFTSP